MGDELQCGGADCGVQIAECRIRNIPHFAFEIPNFLVTPPRIERGTYSLEGCCSIQLSYGASVPAFHLENVCLQQISNTSRGLWQAFDQATLHDTQARMAAVLSLTFPFLCCA